jgi:hypothetical protein
MHKNATKCDKTQSKWCINKHGASKIIDTFEMYHCAQLLWMRQTLEDYGVHCDKVPLLCDNESAIKIAHNPVQYNKTKHIEISHHFIWDHVNRGDINLSYVGTSDQLADIFMKPLDEERFRELRHELNIIDSCNVA